MKGKQIKKENYSVIIVIPIYKETPNNFEDISLKQLFAVLSKYKICIIAPEHLDLKVYNDYGDFIVKRFSTEFFSDLKGYTQLLLSQQFYERFFQYQYLLVYQTDAFVFSDQLQYFCNLDYDYIGAPVKDFGWNYFHVGNGGLSLRKISKCYQVLEEKDKILQTMNEDERKLLEHAEDYFFGYCGWNKKIEFNVPSIWIAAKFSVERDVGHGFRNIIKNGLPFGCHHWNIMNYEIWKYFINGYGYRLPEKIDNNWETLESDRENRLYLFLFYKIHHKDEKYKKIFNDTGLISGEIYSIWGAGQNGKKCIKILKNTSVKISNIYDKSAEKIENIMNIPVRTPKIDIIMKKNSKIIISTEKYQDEISDYLNTLGLYQDKDFLLFSKILKIMKQNIEKEYAGIEGITKKINITSLK